MTCVSQCLPFYHCVLRQSPASVSFFLLGPRLVRTSVARRGSENMYMCFICCLRQPLQGSVKTLAVRSLVEYESTIILWIRSIKANMSPFPSNLYDRVSAHNRLAGRNERIPEIRDPFVDRARIHSGRSNAGEGGGAGPVTSPWGW